MIYMTLEICPFCSKPIEDDTWWFWNHDDHLDKLQDHWRRK